MTDQRPPTLDPVAAARWAQLPVTESPDGSAWLHEEVARRMESRLQWIVKTPAHWVHWAPVRGGLRAHSLLAKRYPKSVCYALEVPIQHAQSAHKNIATLWWQPSAWAQAKVSFEAPKHPVQMVWANMALHMAPEPQTLLSQWHALLEVDGFLMFSCFGPDTLRELRSVYAAHGWQAPSHEFTDMHDWGDMLVVAGFAEPVMDMERISLSFATPERLLAELRGLGRNLNIQRFAGLRGRQWHRKMLDALMALAQPQEDGRLQLTFEVIYGHAFKPRPRALVQAQTTVSLDDMRQQLRQGKLQAPGH